VVFGVAVWPLHLGSMVATLFISLNTFLTLGAFLLIVIGFNTSQWDIRSYSCGCDNHCVFFIGLLKVKYTKPGKCGYNIKEVECSNFNLSNDNCDYYESARDASQLTLALVIVLLLWKIIVNVLTFKFLESHRRTIWIFFLFATLGDLMMGLTAFITVGQFDQVDNWNIVDSNTNKPFHFHHGFGWQCFIGGGVVAWVAAALGGYTLWRGFSPTGDAAPPGLPAADGRPKALQLTRPSRSPYSVFLQQTDPSLGGVE
jgi:hypothetical protein